MGQHLRQARKRVRRKNYKTRVKLRLAEQKASGKKSK